MLLGDLSYNEELVLRAVLRKHGSSRREICAETDMAWTTVQDILTRLELWGYITREVIHRESVGRPRVVFTGMQSLRLLS